MSVRFIFFGLLNSWMVLQGPCAIASAGCDRQTEVLGILFAAAAVQLIGPAAGGWTYGMVEEWPSHVRARRRRWRNLIDSIFSIKVQVFDFPMAHSTDPKTMRWEDVPYIYNIPCCRAIVIPDIELGGLGITEKSVGSSPGADLVFGTSFSSPGSCHGHSLLLALLSQHSSGQCLAPHVGVCPNVSAPTC